MVDISALTASFISTDFIKFIGKSLIAIKKARGKNRTNKAQTILDKTVGELSAKQSEAMTFECIYVNLLEGKIDNDLAIEILSELGYEINPSALQWLKERLIRLREWIIDAIKLLQNIGEELLLNIKEITLEIGLSPKVSITFIPPRR